MKVGDLVRLSSYGKKIKTTTRVVGKDGLGIIISIHHGGDEDTYENTFPYEIKWFNYNKPLNHSRADLKYAI